MMNASDHDHSNCDHHDHSNCDHNHHGHSNFDHHDHSNCDNHDHSNCDHVANVTAASMNQYNATLRATSDLFSAVMYGFCPKVKEILDSNPVLVNNRDEQGHSCMHWAAKKGDIDILRALHSYGADMNIRSNSESGMMPIHWAASDGKILALKFFLDMRQDINVQDLNGCTPIIVAAQHNQIACVIYLLENNADLTLRDNCGDGVLHWSGYKGNVELMALVAYKAPSEIESVDNYGQTPLHLSAIKGNVDCVEYLISECRAEPVRRDKNGQTPINLAQKRNQHLTEWVIRQLTSKSLVDLVRNMDKKMWSDPKILQYLFMGAREKELSHWAWRIVFWSNFLGSITTIYFAMDSQLLDLYYLHRANTMLQVGWWICFIMCLLKSPGFVWDSDAGGNEKFTYEHGLQTIGLFGRGYDAWDPQLQAAVDLLPSLCHTCRVRRPLRSKHCKITKRCIHKFDHFCPFVGNSLGRDNYKYFVGLLTFHFICGILWEVTAFIAIRRSFSWKLLLFMIYSGFWFTIILSLFGEHIRLCSLNLTTNEHINRHKYSYLKDVYNAFSNPFDLKDPWANAIDSLFPSSSVHYRREDIWISR